METTPPSKAVHVRGRPAAGGVEPADEGQHGEVVPFGDELGADHDVASSIAHGIELVAYLVGAAEQIRRQDQRASVGKAFGDLFGQPLDAGAAGNQRPDRLAFRAEFRAPLLVTAMVADEGMAEPMFDQPSRTIRALEPMSAGSA